MSKQKQAEFISTEEKIKAAARKVFTKKGYVSTRTRDIAEAAGMNLALLNYYFRSKEKLFRLIMDEKMQEFFGFLLPVINNPSTTLDEKIKTVASDYIDLLMENPDLPLFILTEIRNNPDYFSRMAGRENPLGKSVLVNQIRKKVPGLNPTHFFVNLLAICIFPFVVSPVLQRLKMVDSKTFKVLAAERKTLIPVWMNAMLNAG